MIRTGKMTLCILGFGGSCKKRTAERSLLVPRSKAVPRETIGRRARIGSKNLCERFGSP